MASVRAELEQVDRKLVVKKDAFGHRLPEEELQSVGFQRLQLCTELACLAAARQSEEGLRARVLRFPQRNALSLHVGDDVCMSLTGIPEDLVGVMARWAFSYLEALGYRVLRTQQMRERFTGTEPRESLALN